MRALVSVLAPLLLLLTPAGGDVRANTFITNDSSHKISVLTVFVNFGEKSGLGGEPTAKAVMPGNHGARLGRILQACPRRDGPPASCS